MAEMMSRQKLRQALPAIGRYAWAVLAVVCMPASGRRSIKPRVIRQSAVLGGAAAVLAGMAMLLLP
jgi:hypothetical protein